MKQHVRMAAAGIAAATLVGMAGCGAEEAADHDAPTALTNCDTTVSLDAPVERAIAVNQPAAELLLSLGVEDRLAGLAFVDDPVLPELEQRASEVFRFDDEFPSFEAVLDRDPDLVYTTFDYTFSAEGIADRQRFTDLGVATYQSPSECGGQDAVQDSELTLDDLYAEIGDVSTLFGVSERGDALVADLRSRAEAAADGIDPSGVTLAWWYAGTATPYIAGCCGAPGIMTREVGAVNAFADSRQLWPEIGWESVLDRDPAVLVLADLGRGGDGDSAEAKIRFLESDPVASRLTAVQNKRYIVISGTTMDPSIRNVAGIEELAAGLRDLGVAQ
ncbi:ABC transporter substrate-binding protein [Rhodococcus sp. NPDC003318]|uniref:ABC transporter substrate-binding protein n=1 Tax=Rhodococcus sp. NPDC003318 TaxID=3364503 RepID=UPI0036AFD26C